MHIKESFLFQNWRKTSVAISDRSYQYVDWTMIALFNVWTIGGLFCNVNEVCLQLSFYQTSKLSLAGKKKRPYDKVPSTQDVFFKWWSNVDQCQHRKKTCLLSYCQTFLLVSDKHIAGVGSTCLFGSQSWTRSEKCIALIFLVQYLAINFHRRVFVRRSTQSGKCATKRLNFLFSTTFKKEIYNICKLTKTLINLISWLIEMVPPLLKTKHRQSQRTTRRKLVLALIMHKKLNKEL